MFLRVLIQSRRQMSVALTGRISRITHPGICRQLTTDSTRPMLTLSDRAKAQLLSILAEREADGIRVSLEARGCAGASYKFDLINKGCLQSSLKEGDELVKVASGLNIVIDNHAQMYIIGTQMDYVSDKLRSEFVFKNPNAIGVCGCGESFRFPKTQQ